MWEQIPTDLKEKRGETVPYLEQELAEGNCWAQGNSSLPWFWADGSTETLCDLGFTKGDSDNDTMWNNQSFIFLFCKSWVDKDQSQSQPATHYPQHPGQWRHSVGQGPPNYSALQKYLLDSCKCKHCPWCWEYARPSLSTASTPSLVFGVCGHCLMETVPRLH